MLDAEHAAGQPMQVNRCQQIGLRRRQRMGRVGDDFIAKLIRRRDDELVLGNHATYASPHPIPSAAPTRAASVSHRPVSSQEPNVPAGAFSRTDSLD